MEELLSLPPVLQILGFLIGPFLGGIVALYVSLRMSKPNANEVQSKASKNNADAATTIAEAAASAVKQLIGPLTERIECLEQDKDAKEIEISALKEDVKKANAEISKATEENIKLHKKVAILEASERGLRLINQRLIKAISDNITARSRIAEEHNLPCTTHCSPADEVLSNTLNDILSSQEISHVVQS